MSDTEVDAPPGPQWAIANGWDEIHPLIPPWPAEDAEALVLYLADLDPDFRILRHDGTRWVPLAVEHRPGPGGAQEHRVRPDGEWRPCHHRRGQAIHPGRG